MFAVIIAAGLRGIKDNYPLPAPAEDDVWSLSDAERRAMGYVDLPNSVWAWRVEAMERSEFIAETLGEHVYEFFLRNKKAEWEAYRRQVTPYELSRYLGL